MSKKNQKSQLAATVTETPVIATALDITETLLADDTTDPSMPMGENGNELVDEAIFSQEHNESQTIEEQKAEDEALATEAQELTEKDIEIATFIADATLETTSELTETDLEIAAATLASDHELPATTEEVSTTEASVSADEAPGDTEEPAKPTLAELTDAISQEDANEFATEVGKALDRRIDFERSRPDYKEAIMRSLNSARRDLANPRAARIMMVANVDPDFLNAEVHTGARYNVYALGKLADILRALTDKSIGNAINRACMVSLFRARANKVAFDMELAKSAASNQYRPKDPAVKKWLMSHTVSTSTAPTQASSTMQALRTIGIVRSEGSVKAPTFVIQDTPMARAAEEVIKAIAA